MLRFTLILALGTIPTLLPGQTQPHRPSTPTPLPSLQDWVDDPGLFENTPETFGARLGAPLKFHWVSQDRQEARGTHPSLSYHGHKVYEAVVRFRDNRVAEVVLSLFNRGDAGELNMADFEARCRAMETTAQQLASGPAEDLSPPTGPGGRREKVLVWTQPGKIIRLRHSSTRLSGAQTGFRPEYLEFASIAPAHYRPAANRGQTRPSISAVDLRELVNRQTPGRTWLPGVPMVDQGQKGYCSVATTERVMRYYGMEVNQHELAQRAQSEAKGGTDPESLIKALRALALQAGLKLDMISPWEPKDFFDLVNDYNQTAKREKAAEIVLSGRTVMISDVYAKMDYGLLKKTRLRKSSGPAAFNRQIRDRIDAGVPVVWNVMLGLVKETPPTPQRLGGHTRLIIGYTDDGKILYSDSWGYGHEVKEMDAEDAFVITTGIFAIQPRL